MTTSRNGRPYAVSINTSAEPLSLEDLIYLAAGIQATEAVIGRTCKGGRVYNRHPALIAEVNRCGNRFLAALTSVVNLAREQAEATKQARGG